MFAKVSGMAHPKNREAMAELGDHLTALRARLPQPDRSWRKIAARIEADQGVQISHEQLRQMHSGEVDPTSSRPEHLIAVAKFYGVNSIDLGHHAGHRLGDLMALTQNWK